MAWNIASVQWFTLISVGHWLQKHKDRGEGGVESESWEINLYFVFKQIAESDTMVDQEVYLEWSRQQRLWFWENWQNCWEYRQDALEAGADPDWSEGWSEACLMVAARNNHRGMVTLLLCRPDVDVDAKNENNMTALHWACWNNSIASLVKLLAAPNVQFNERNNVHDTPIMVAIRRGMTEAVRLMAAVEEVDLDVTDSEGLGLEQIANG